jgi:hypothetical protein
VSAQVISRLKGGLGNQLFCYAAARRLAVVNHAELVIDDVTGFARDRLYRRRYSLDRFNISARKATARERMEPFERYRRGVAKWLARRHPFSERRYLEQEGIEFDERLLSKKVDGVLRLDGLWQSEQYFLDVEQTIRRDLTIVGPTDAANKRMEEAILGSNAVALHVRWFDAPGAESNHNVSADYYRRAIRLVEERVESPRYFLFSDDPDAARRTLGLPESQVTAVVHNRGDENAYADLWLITLCRHFITANSTFSWWGAWLGGQAGKVVVTSSLKTDGKTAWGFRGLIPDGWLQT